MFKFGISLLFVTFSQLLFYIVAAKAFYLGFSAMGFIIFIIEFSIAGWLINVGYAKEFNKKD